MDEHTIEKFRERSGNVRSKDPLVSFLYVLMRDHVLPSDIENIIQRGLPKDGQDVLFTNGWLANYAKDITKRIREGKRK